MIAKEIEILLLNAEAKELTEYDSYHWFVARGLTPGIASRLAELANKVMVFGGRAYRVGKIILKHIRDFVLQHPYLAIGVLVGAAVAHLISSIPILGFLLKPLAPWITIPMAVIAGWKLDKKERVDKGVMGLFQTVIELAHDFFKILIDAFRGFDLNDRG